MVEGDEWKHKNRMATWNSPKKIWLSEYTSFRKIIYSEILGNFSRNGGSINRSLVEVTRTELDMKLENPSFENLPFPIKDAYQKVAIFLRTLESASDEEIEKERITLEGVFDLSISCVSYCDSMDSLYVGRDPCRESRIKTKAAILDARRKGKSNLIDAIDEITSTCLRCPYK